MNMLTEIANNRHGKIAFVIGSWSQAPPVENQQQQQQSMYVNVYTGLAVEQLATQLIVFI